MMERKQLAEKLELGSEEILAALTHTLHKYGFAGVQIVSFAVVPEDEAPFKSMAIDAPCPVRCVVLPDGRIRCEPQC